MIVVPHRARATTAREGPSVVFTGALEELTRAEAEDLVERRGGRPKGVVTRGTSFAVAGSNPGTKLAQARALGIPVFSEKQFLRRYLAQSREGRLKPTRLQ